MGSLVADRSSAVPLTSERRVICPRVFCLDDGVWEDGPHGGPRSPSLWSDGIHFNESKKAVGLVGFCSRWLCGFLARGGA